MIVIAFFTLVLTIVGGLLTLVIPLLPVIGIVILTEKPENEYLILQNRTAPFTERMLSCFCYRKLPPMKQKMLRENHTAEREYAAA